MAYDRVKKLHPHTVYIDGESSERERAVSLRRYNDYGDTVLIGTIAALETGLNLQAGSQAVFLEQHWLSTSNDQAVARLFRRGQSRPTLIYWLYCPKTFDMRVRKVAEGRGAEIDRALDAFIDEEDWAA